MAKSGCVHMYCHNNVLNQLAPTELSSTDDTANTCTSEGTEATGRREAGQEAEEDHPPDNTFMTLHVARGRIKKNGITKYKK